MGIERVKGRAYWTKLESPVPAYNPEEREYTIDLALEPEGVTKLVKLGLSKGIKNKGDDRGPFYTFKRRELKKKTGQPNQPVNIRWANGHEWIPGTKIGNGSVVEVKFNVFEVPAFGKLPAHPKDAILEVSVIELIEYVRPETTDFGGATTTGSSSGYKESWKGDVV